MNKTLTLIIILTLMGFLGYFIVTKDNSKSLSTPQTKTYSSPVPTIVPTPSPRTFKYDRSTDLKKELDSVNPQILDSDFE